MTIDTARASGSVFPPHPCSRHHIHSLWCQSVRSCFRAAEYFIDGDLAHRRSNFTSDEGYSRHSIIYLSL